MFPDKNNEAVFIKTEKDFSLELAMKFTATTNQYVWFGFPPGVWLFANIKGRVLKRLSGILSIFSNTEKMDGNQKILNYISNLISTKSD